MKPTSPPKACSLNVLAIGAHPDDVELGCGATLAKHIEDGDQVQILHLSLGVGAREYPELPSNDVVIARLDAAEAAAKILGVQLSWCKPGLLDQRFNEQPFLSVVKFIEKFQFRPDIVYTHSLHDLNEDHCITARAVCTAFRYICRPFTLLSFEVLSSTEWGTGFWPTWFNPVSKVCFDKKLEALRQYGSEIRVDNHPRSLASVRNLALVRGSTVGAHYAEAFQLVRRVR